MTHMVHCLVMEWWTPFEECSIVRQSDDMAAPSFQVLMGLGFSLVPLSAADNAVCGKSSPTGKSVPASTSVFPYGVS